MRQEGETKRKLLETAIAMIWESSYGSVSVDDICTRAGINKGSFYYAFKSKSDLAVAAYERHWQMMQAALDQVFSAQLSPVDRIDRYCQLIIDGQQAKYESFGKILGCPFCSLGSELSTQDENIRLKAEQISARMIKYFESLVRDLSNEGQIKAQDVSEVARELHSYLAGVLVQAKIENSLKPLQRLKPGIIRLLNLKTPEIVVV